MQTGLLLYVLHRHRRLRADVRELISRILADRNRIEPAVHTLADLLTDVANATARSGDSLHMLSKRLDRILATSRGEGYSVKESYLSLSDICDAGLAADLQRRFPALSRTEAGLCCMIVRGFDPSCISKVFGYDHEQTFYNKRTEIRRKLGIDRSVPLERFLNDEAARLRKEQRRYLEQWVDRH